MAAVRCFSSVYKVYFVKHLMFQSYINLRTFRKVENTVSSIDQCIETKHWFLPWIHL